MNDERNTSLQWIVARAVRFFRQRGTPALRRGARRCVRCAKVIPGNDPFCAYCGAPQLPGGRGGRG